MKELNRSYQELRCYTSLDNSHKKIFDCIVDFYGPKLNQQCFVDTTLFTAHDFNKHCNNIYRIISNIILANAKISSKEWLILDLAVLFHDISMSEKLPVSVSRKTHSKGSAEYVMREWKNNNSVLKIEISRIDALALNDIYALCGIIQAHSDVKDPSISIDKNGLNDPTLSFDQNGVNSLGLAAVLRLADELDVTSDRLGNESFAEQLSTEDEEQLFSANRWEDLHFCSNICIQTDDTFKLNYICDDRYIQETIDSGKQSQTEITNRILDIIQKINASLNLTHQKAFASEKCAHFAFKCRDIIPKSYILSFDRTAEIIDSDVESNKNSSDLSNVEITDNSGPVIWLPDAELAIGEQTRFETYSKVGAVGKFIPDKITTEDAIWGISAIKGAGKTFLLQVKRVKVSSKYFTIPLVGKPSSDNRWATETISNIKNTHIYGYTVEDLSTLWKYSIVCHVILTYSYYLNKSKTKGAKNRYNKLAEFINSYKLSNFTKGILKSVLNYSLDGIMSQVVCTPNWKNIITDDYTNLKFCAEYAIELLLDQRSNRKAGFALFLDKVDQFIDPPEADDPPEGCVGCEYKHRIEECKIKEKSEDFCRENCKEMCCYTCSTFSDAYAGTKIRTASSKQNELFSHVNYWQYFQLALINAAYNIKLDFNGGIKVFFTVREEALNCEDNIFHDRKAKVFGIFERIYYTKEDQRTIFYESIQNEENIDKLFDSKLKIEDPECAFVGVNSLCHPYVRGEKETVFDSIYRHSFDRARDIQHHGKALAQKVNKLKKISDLKKREEEVKKTIEDTAASLLIQGRGLPSYYEEKMDIMPRYWRDRQHFLSFIQKLDRNLLFSDDLVEICREFNKEVDMELCDGKHCNENNCDRHPFSFLYKLGLLGIISYNKSNEGEIQQKFVNSNEITYFHEADELYTDPNTCYILHPALTKAIESFTKTNIHHFKGFILGKSLNVSKDSLKELLDDKKTLSKTEFDKKYYS